MAAAVSVGDIFSRWVISDEGSAQLSKIQGRLKSFESKLQSTGVKVAALGTALSVGVTLPLIALATGSVRAASRFESSFAGVRKTVDGVVDSFGNLTPIGAQLQQQFRDLAKEIPVSVNELNRIGESAGQLGIKAKDVIGFTKVMANLAVTTNLTSEAAANATARIQNIFQGSGKDTDRFASSLVALGNAGASTESEIIDFGLRIAGAGKQAGLAQADILGIGSAMASVGVESEAGGTAVQKVLLAMSQAVAQGNEDLRVFAQTARLSSEEFATAFRGDAANAFTLFVEGLGAQGERAFNTLEALNLQDQRLIRSFLSLSGAGELLRNQIALGNDAWETNEALIKEAAQRYKTFGSRLQIFKSRLEDIRITLGGALIPILLNLLDALDPVINLVSRGANLFAQLPRPVQVVTVALAGMIAAVGPIVVVLGGLVALGGPLIGVLGTVATGALGVVAALGPLGVVIGVVASGLVVLAAELTGLAFAARSVTGDWEFLLGPLREAKPLLREIAGLASDVGSTGFRLMAQGAREVLGAVNDLLGPLGGLEQLIRNTAKGAEIFLGVITARVKQARDQIALLTDLNVGDITPDTPAAFRPRVQGLPDISEALSQSEALSASLQRTAINNGLATDTLAEQLRTARDAVSALTAAERSEIQAGLELGLSMEDLSSKTGVAEDILRLYARGAKEATKATTELHDELAQIRAEFTGQGLVDRANQLAEALKGVPTRLIDPAQMDALRRGLVAGAIAAERLGKEVDGVVDLLAKLEPPDTFVRDLRASELAAERLGDAIEPLPDAFGDFTNIVESAVGPLELTADAGRRLNGVIDPLTDDFARMKETQREAAEESRRFHDSIRGLSSALSELAQISGGGALSSLAQIVGLMAVGVESAELIKQGIKTGGASGAIQAATGVAGAVGALDAATDKAGRGDRAISGALTGAAIGNQFVPVAGAVVGFIAGAVIGLLRNPGWDDVAKRVSFRLGVDITEELAKGIDQTAEKRFGGNRAAAEIFHLDDIIQEAGGLNVSNFDKLLGGLRDAFSAQETGVFTAGELTQVLQENFGAFAQFVQQQTTVASEGFAEILQLANQFGATTLEMQQLVTQETGALGTSIEAMIGASDRSAASFERLGIIASASFNAAIDAGLGLAEASRQLAPGVEALIALQEELGITSENAALRQLIHFQELATQFPELIAGADALNQTMLSLSRIGGLNAETLSAMGKQGLETFDALRAAGFKESQALQLMQGFLRNIAQAYTDLGIPIDKSTAKLLDLANENNVLKGEARDMATILVDGFNQVTDAVHLLVDVLGGQVPAAANRAAAAINRIPRNIDVEINQKFTSEGRRDDLPRLGGGGIVRNPTVAMIGESGPEAVIPLPSGIQGMAAKQPIIVQVDGREIASVVVDYGPEIFERLGVS